jgi:hypothetical protein
MAMLLLCHHIRQGRLATASPLPVKNSPHTTQLVTEAADLRSKLVKGSFHSHWDWGGHLGCRHCGRGCELGSHTRRAAATPPFAGGNGGIA